jgi:hypothetical protein
MSEKLVKLLDLELAWKRTRSDTSNRVFIRHPNEVKLIEMDLPMWLEKVRESLRSDTFNPSPMFVCDVPKGNGAVRPGGHILMQDRLVYAAAVGACLARIQAALSGTNREVDFSYRLGQDPRRPDFFQDPVGGWRSFASRSLAKIEEGVPYVVICDITGYYENIDISTLMSDLKQINAPAEAVNLLSTCLNRWGQIPGRGIPQGHSSSDVLGKLYLNSVDENLRLMGYTHYRYVDDIRIFCHNLVQAKKALVDLTRLLRKRGLNLQSAKSQIHRADEAKIIIEGVVPIINSVRHNIIDEALALSDGVDPYISITAAEAILSDNPNEAPIDLIRETFRTYFIDSEDRKFDKTLFRFLLNRLAVYKDTFAVEHCKTLLERQPQETHTILAYFKATEVIDHIEPELVHFLNSDAAVYPYQLYQIIEWANNVGLKPSEDFVSVARQLAFDNLQPYYVRLVSRSFLGQHGTSADLERLEQIYAEATSPIEQSELICALRKMEMGRRNAFLRRSERDGEMNRRAVMLVKSGGT